MYMCWVNIAKDNETLSGIHLPAYLLMTMTLCKLTETKHNISRFQPWSLYDNLQIKYLLHLIPKSVYIIFT